MILSSFSYLHCMNPGGFVELMHRTVTPRRKKGKRLNSHLDSFDDVASEFTPYVYQIGCGQRSCGTGC